MEAVTKNRGVAALRQLPLWVSKQTLVAATLQP